MLYTIYLKIHVSIKKKEKKMSVELARWFPARSAEAFLTRSTAALVSDVSTIGITHHATAHPIIAQPTLHI